MPQIGERRTGAAETVEWDGRRWQPVAAEAAPSEMYHPGLGDTPASAALHELARTGKEAALGLLHSPVDAFKNLLGAPKQVMEGLVGPQGLPALVADPSLLKEAPAAAMEGARSLGNNPREAGSLLGQMLMGKYAPEIGSAASDVAGAVPGAMVKTGEAMARGGNKMKTAGGVSVGGMHVPLSTLGIAEAAMRMDPKGLAVAAAPYALEYGGKGVAATGRALESLREMRQPKPAAEPWDPAGPSKRAAAEAAQQTTREEASGVTPEDIGSVPYQTRQAPLSDDMNASLGTYGRDAIPAEFGARAKGMGNATLQTLRDGGYDAPAGGFQSSADIDRMLNKGTSGPVEADLTDELDSLSPLDRLSRLAARQQERYGRSFRPEF